MTNEEMSKLLLALATNAQALNGRLEAQATIIEALTFTILQAFPPLANEITQHITGMATYARQQLEPEAAAAFDNSIASMLSNVSRMTGA